MQLKSLIGENTALIVGVQPVSLGLIAAPGDYGADIVVGEGQPFGIGPTAGGPIYGLFACRDAYIRQMPGRIVGLSKDSDGGAHLLSHLVQRATYSKTSCYIQHLLQ